MIMVTGVAGFIGFHVAQALLARGDAVVGVDNINEYYDPSLKRARLARLAGRTGFLFEQLDICDHGRMRALVEGRGVRRICHLAAQAGVRYSLDHPFAYEKSNGEGFLSVIECARRVRVDNFVYASSSSVYGANTKLPFSETDPVDNPISLYAATKKANELVAHCYSRLYGVPCSGLRFFTVYGPWGRPDMALFIFTKRILDGAPIDVYNNGDMKRNFTYVDDIVKGVIAALDSPVACEIYNIGNNRAELLMDFIATIETAIGKKAVLNYLPMQPGDVPATVADIAKISRLGYAPSTDIAEGIPKFVAWYREYYGV